ncbi:hypothetical protein [Streptomyces cucumeris]|nr:hypothetical protein [Streptomyces sp. NEAU-Y11]MCP9209969.1 hypothetical protein [Streptomyces sp. NEAU-Y11]
MLLALFAGGAAVALGLLAAVDRRALVPVLGTTALVLTLAAASFAALSH